MSLENTKESATETRVRLKREAEEERKRSLVIGQTVNSATLKPPAVEVSSKPELMPQAVLTTLAVSSQPENIHKMIAMAVEAIAQNTNPIQIAKMLAAIQATGLKNRPLALELGKSEAWVSKRLRLLTASAEVQNQIETGVLSEYHYYSDRTRIEAKAGKVKRQTQRYERLPSVTVNAEAAEALVQILQKLAKQYQLPSISLTEKSVRLQALSPSKYEKKDMVIVLNYRAHDILKAMK